MSPKCVYNSPGFPPDITGLSIGSTPYNYTDKGKTLSYKIGISLYSLIY